MINEIKCKNSYTGWVMDKTIRTSGNIGSVVDFTEQTSQNYNYQIIPCLAGSEFTLTLQGATYARAWCFVDKDDKIVSHANANAVVTNFQIVAPCDGKLIVNNYKLGVPNPSVTGVCRCDRIQHKDGEVRKVYCNEVLDSWVTGKRINTGSYNVGDVVAFTEVSDANFSCQIIPCLIGNEFTLNLRGGNAPRAWNFVTTEKKLVSKSDEAATATDLVITAPCDGYLIVNNYRLGVANPSVKKLSKIWYPHGLVDIGANQSFSWVTGKNIPVGSVDVGSVVDFTEQTYNDCSYSLTSMKKDDTFTLTCKGGSNPRAWAFLDNQRKLISKADPSTTCSSSTLTAPCDGYLIVHNITSTQANPSLVRTNAHTYPTVKIGTREWLGANLDETLGKIQTDEFYYNDDKFTYGKYGKLYSWNIINSAIFLPTGWRIPTKTDFEALIDMDSTGALFRDENFSNGNNNSNMSLLASGSKRIAGFDGIGSYFEGWGNTSSTVVARFKTVNSVASVDELGSKTEGRSIRLVRDHLPTPTYTLPRTTFTGQIVETNKKLLMPTGTSGALDNWTLFYNCIENNCTNSGRLLDVVGGYENVFGQAVIGSGDSSGKFGCSYNIRTTWYPMLTGATGKIAIRRSTNKDYIQYSLDGVIWIDTGIQVASLYEVVGSRTSLTFGGWADTSKLGAGTISATLWDTALDDVSSMFV